MRVVVVWLLKEEGFLVENPPIYTISSPSSFLLVDNLLLVKEKKSGKDYSGAGGGYILVAKKKLCAFELLTGYLEKEL